MNQKRTVVERFIENHLLAGGAADLATGAYKCVWQAVSRVECRPGRKARRLRGRLLELDTEEEVLKRQSVTCLGAFSTAGKHDGGGASAWERDDEDPAGECITRRIATLRLGVV